MREIKINSTTGSEITSTSDFKNYARIDYSTDDTLIGRILTQARIWCENYISKDIVAKNRTYYVPETNGIFDLPFGPISSIESVTIDGTAFTGYTMLGLNNETIDLDGPAENVKVTYITSGIDDAFLVQAIYQYASTLYDNRADFVEGKANNIISTNVKEILKEYKTMFV